MASVDRNVGRTRHSGAHGLARRIPNWGVQLTGFSADGSRAFWHGMRFDVGIGGNNERLMTDTTSGEIVHEHAFALDSSNGTALPLAASPDGHFYVEHGILVDTLTGQERVLSAAEAYFDDQLTATALTVSQNGRFVVYHTRRRQDVYLTSQALHLWDTEHHTGVLVVDDSADDPNFRYGFDVAGVGDDGRLVYSRWAGPTMEIVDRALDGTSAVVGPYLANESFKTTHYWTHRYLVGTPDLRSVVLSRKLPPTDQSRVAVLRCS